MKHVVDVPTFLWFLTLPQMPFVKNIKSDAYFSRYQVKYRRRREGKTDCTLLCLTHKVPKVMFPVRLRAQTVSGAGKKQVVCRRSRMRVTVY
jgi:hypothetical protein